VNFIYFALPAISLAGAICWLSAEPPIVFVAFSLAHKSFYAFKGYFDICKTVIK